MRAVNRQDKVNGFGSTLVSAVGVDGGERGNAGAGDAALTAAETRGAETRTSSEGLLGRRDADDATENEGLLLLWLRRRPAAGSRGPAPPPHSRRVPRHDPFQDPRASPSLSILAPTRACYTAQSFNGPIQPNSTLIYIWPIQDP